MDGSRRVEGEVGRIEPSKSPPTLPPLSLSLGHLQVDIMSWRSKTDRIHAQIKDICAILSGLVVAQNYKKGQQLIRDRSFKDNAAFFQVLFLRILGRCLFPLLKEGEGGSSTSL